jgi:hypothetical protein
LPLSGNTNKLSIALALVRVAACIAPGSRVLVDSRYMRKRFVLPLLNRGLRIIGQVHRDTALFLPPEPAAARRRGRPRQYGERLTQDRIDALAAEEHHRRLYGKLKLVLLRSTLVVVRFLKGTLVRAVWDEFFDPKKQCWSQPRLLIATETGLVPTHILQFYALRWGIESLFQNLKRWWGANNHWQQSRRVLELWMQVRSTGYALMHLLALLLPETFPLATIAPWRKHKPVITASLFAAWMRQHLDLRFARPTTASRRNSPSPRLASTHLFSPPLPESANAACAQVREPHPRFCIRKIIGDTPNLLRKSRPSRLPLPMPQRLAILSTGKSVSTSNLQMISKRVRVKYSEGVTPSSLLKRRG